jgi:hypothetical protein
MEHRPALRVGPLTVASANHRSPSPTLPKHGAESLPVVDVDCYGLTIDDGNADHEVNAGAFRQVLEALRKPLRRSGHDPLGTLRSRDMSWQRLGRILSEGDPEASAAVQGATEDFAQRLAGVVRRTLASKDWKGTELVVVGGGFGASRVGQLVVARAHIILASERCNVDLRVIHHDPNEAGLIGSTHLLPSGMVDGYDAILAIDIGGSNVRAGIVKLTRSNEGDLSVGRIAKMKFWRHAEERDIDRDQLVSRLLTMLTELVDGAQERALNLAPFVGVGCPGLIRADGSIERGAQNLPGNWGAAHFHLPGAIRERIPRIGQCETLVVMHNDAVVQGLSEIAYLGDTRYWGVLTIGTGLGNAHFTTTRKAGAEHAAR